MLQQMLILGFFSVAAYQDYRKKSIEVCFLLFSGIFAILLHLYDMQMSVLEMLMGAAVGGFAVCGRLFLKDGIGMGDGAILAVSGLFLGFENNLQVFIIGILLSGITALFLLIGKRKGQTDKIPFAPFLLVGYLFVLGME